MALEVGRTSVTAGLVAGGSVSPRRPVTIRNLSRVYGRGSRDVVSRLAGVALAGEPLQVYVVRTAPTASPAVTTYEGADNA